MDSDLRALLGHGVKCKGIGIPEPRMLAARGHETSEASCEALVKSLLGRTDLNYVGHRSCISKASDRERRVRKREETAALRERKAEVRGQEWSQIERAKRSGAWLTDVLHRFNVIELSQE